MRSLLLLLMLVVAVNASGANAAATSLAVGDQSSLMLDGTSNLAGWRCRATALSGAATIQAPLFEINDLIDRIESGDIEPLMRSRGRAGFPVPRFDLEVPIEALRCTGGRPMEADLRRSLQATSFPAIRFELLGVTGPISHDIDRGDYHTRVSGNVSISGKTRRIEVDVRLRRLDRDRFRIDAQIPMKMSDFGVRPPTALLGLIKASDAMAVRFALTLVGAGR